MARPRTSRRPTVFDAAKTGVTISDESPAANATVARTITWALMGVGDKTFIDVDVARLRETVRTGGIDTIAYVWSHSPEFTLPSALWRVYLLHEWYHRDPLLMAERYTGGSHAPIIQGLEAPVELQPLSPVVEEADSLLRGDLTGNNFEYVLGKALHVMRVFAAGEAGALWIEDPADPLARRITVHHPALLVTTDELDIVAREAAISTLSWPRVRYVVTDLGIPWTTS